MDERIYSGRILSLHRERHRLPDGRQADFEIVRHPGGAGVLPVTADGELVLLRQFRPVAGGEVIEIPAGRLEAEESPRACAERELREEAGLAAGWLKPLGWYWSSVGFCDERIHLFVAGDLRQVGQRTESDEFIEPFRVGLDRALAMIAEGRIRDGKTMLAMLRLAQEGGVP
ncbi:ADP-ribose pyrophosphatase [Geothermobacter ehrlichii]|uniref:GDP-mannose pyrophosphatase n=1 Tax=Geothermobacter ehrlichii TaxID=213224 RepID=A0A5D3WK10_9BACT|nr:NUDIX hydrolase [Geothermobacter ehrlichii]TYO98941.1 ADP-ribose pyrophosphatase [Geothermobacter ehrlichii]